MAQQILLMQRAESFFSKKRTPQRAPSSESVRLVKIQTLLCVKYTLHSGKVPKSHPTKKSDKTEK